MASADVQIYKYKDLPKKKFSERHGVNNLANVKSPLFKARFGTVSKPIHRGTGIRHYISSFRSKTELENWKRLIKQFCASTTIISCQESKMNTFNAIYKHRGKIFDFLVGRYEKKEIKELSLAGNINMLATMCLYSNPFEKSVREVCNNMFSYATTLQRKIHAVKYGNNVLTEKEMENFVPFTELVKKRDELENEFIVTDFDELKYPQSLKEC